MTLRSRDFESRASASSTTPASSGAARPGHYLYTASRADSNTSGLFSKSIHTGKDFSPLCRYELQGGGLVPWIFSGGSPYCAPRRSLPLR